MHIPWPGEGTPLEDKVIKCRDCGAEFLFSVGEQ